MIYLDGHSTTQLDPRVFDKMKPYFFEKYGNATKGVNRFNWEAEAAVESARKAIAQFFNVSDSEIFFTSGATESNHIAILGLENDLREKKRMTILSTEIEHSSVLGPLRILEKRGFEIQFVKVDQTGKVDLDDFKMKLTDQVGLVSIAFANHEIGVIQDVAKLSSLSHEKGAIFHSDAVQAIGKIEFEFEKLGIDLMTLSAHKLYGPKGIGALYVKRKNPRVKLEPLFLGGQQERGLRPGTLNTPAIVGFGAAIEILQSEQSQEIQKMKLLRDALWVNIQMELPCVLRNGMTKNSQSLEFLPNNLNISIEGIDGSALFSRIKSFAVSNASACLNGIQDYSQVLTVLGVPKALARASLRFGIGRFNKLEELSIVARELAGEVRLLREMEKKFAEQTGLEYPLNGCTK